MKKENLIISQNEKINILDSKKKSKGNTKWLIEIFITSLCLSVLFALISELMLSHTNLAMAFILIFLLMFVSVLFDMVGMAVTACSIKPLLDLSKKKVVGANLAIKLVKNADKVSCICTDVVGDICSILCGAGGVSISLLIIKTIPELNTIIISILINAIIASVTILGKAIGKTYALNSSLNVVLRVSKFLSMFKRSKSIKKHKNE